MKRNFFSLTYTDKILRLVKITNKNIESVYQAEIPAGLVNGGKIERLKAFAEVINEAKNNAKPRKITALEVIAAVPEEKVFLKIIQIPKMSLEKIDSAILWQIESIIPFEQKEIYFNWKIIGSTTDKLVVLIAVCEKKIVDSLFESLILAKIKPLIITFPSAGLANLLAVGSRLAIVVDLSKKNNISLVVAKNKNVYFSTSRHIDDEFKGLEKIIYNIVDYYHKKNSQEEIGNILVFGPPSLAKIEANLQKVISEKIKIARATDIKIISNIKEEYISYIDNLGLDLSLEKLSLLPPEVRENARNETTNYHLASILNYFILFILLILLSASAIWVKIYYDTLKVSNEYANLQKNQTTSSQKDLEANINMLNEKIAIIQSIPFATAIKPSFIEKITSCVDANITLKEIKVEANKNVKIKGVAKSRNDLIIFKDKLNNLAIMNPINLPISALEKKENVDFELATSKR